MKANDPATLAALAKTGGAAATTGQIVACCHVGGKPGAPANKQDARRSAGKTCETAAPRTGKSLQFSGLGWWVAGVGWAHLSPARSDRDRQRTAQPCQVSAESLPLQNERGAGLGAQLHLHENAPILISKTHPRRPEDGWCSRFRPACMLE